MRQEIFQLQTVRHQGPQEQELDGGRRGVRAVNETGGPEARRSAGALAIPVDTMWTWHNGGMLKSPAPQLQTTATLLLLKLLAPHLLFSSPVAQSESLPWASAWAAPTDC